LHEFEEIDAPDRQQEVTDLDALRNRALAASSEVREAISRLQAIRKRSEEVKDYVLARAAGVCEGCNHPAPFFTKASQKRPSRPYLEPHHTRRLSDSGPDHPAWVVAVCPNCHRRAHSGQDGEEYNQLLIKKANDLELKK
jgi:5-methylcytosine-specific restriction enzyme A